MRATRKSVSAALFALLSSAYNFDKKIRHGENIANQDTLTLMLFCDLENEKQPQALGLEQYVRKYICIVCGRASDTTGVEADAAMDKIEDILDALDTTMHPMIGMQQTLRDQNGGVDLVTDCYIDADKMIMPPIEQQEWAIWMSIQVLVGP